MHTYNILHAPSLSVCVYVHIHACVMLVVKSRASALLDKGPATEIQLQSSV